MGLVLGSWDQGVVGWSKVTLCVKLTLSTDPLNARGRYRVENLLRHPSQTNLEGRAANLKNPVVKTYQKFSSESAENAPLIKFGGDGNI